MPTPDPGTQLVRSAPESQLPALAQPQGPSYWEHEGVSLADYLRILRARKWVILSITATVVFLAGLQNQTTTPLYTSSTTLQVNPESSNILPYQEVTSNPGGGYLFSEYLTTQTRKLATRSLAQRVVARLEVVEDDPRWGPIRQGILFDSLGFTQKLMRSLFRQFLPASPKKPGMTGNGDSQGKKIGDKLADRLLGGLSVAPMRNTRLIDVSYTSPDPALSQLVTTAIVEEFIAQHLLEKYNATIVATDFLRDQLDELKITVERSEEQSLRYARTKGIVNLGERETISGQRLVALSEELSRVEGELIVTAARLSAASSENRGVFPRALKNETILSLETLVSNSERELAVLLSQFGAEWPAVEGAKSTIAELHGQLEDERAKTRSTAGADYRFVQDERNRLQAALQAQRALVDQLDEDSIQYNILAREVETNKALYEGLLQRLKEAAVAAGLESTNITLVDSASLPTSASSPQKTRNMAVALLFGLGLAVGTVLIAHTLDNSLRTADDVSNLGLPSLGIVPHMGFAKGARGLLFRHSDSQVETRTAFLTIALEGGTQGLSGIGWEAYRSMRTALLLSHSEQPPKTILVTSALPGEGKTTTATNLAIALAQTGARTILLELDLRRPTLAGSFDLAMAEGASTYLTGNTDLSSQIRETGIQDLFVLPAGPEPPNPPELLDSERMRSGLDLLQEYFTYVIIDSPPTLQLSDALILGPRVDGVVVVARSGKTPRQAVRQTAEHLSGTGSTLLGVVLNGVDMKGNGYGYGYGYGYGKKAYGSYHSSASAES